MKTSKFFVTSVCESKDPSHPFFFVKGVILDRVDYDKKCRGSFLPSGVLVDVTSADCITAGDEFEVVEVGYFDRNGNKLYRMI